MPTVLEGPAVVRSPGSSPWSGLRVHMIGIGGCGMSGAALLLRRLGAAVSGSDLSPFDGLAGLVARGIRVSIGHREAQLDPLTDRVVVSAAIPADNAEWSLARRLGIPVIKYAQLLGELTAIRKGVAIAGTHGKSTTSAMCAYVFREAGLQPSFLIGGRCDQLGGHSGLGSGPHLIVESCEFDRSFLHLEPELAAILNIEADHLDCYRDLNEIVDAFAGFAERVKPSGLLVCNGEDVLVRHAARKCSAAVQTFGFTEDVDWQATNLCPDHGRMAFDVRFGGVRILSTRLAIPGRHNVANALAAIALAHRAGADLERVSRALTKFTGVNRRLTWRGEGRGVTVIDDYAHHPTEIRVTIEAARCRYSPKRTWVIFQPHQYSRTRYLMDEFAGSFMQADEIVVPDVYGAREIPSGQDGRASEELVSRICRRGGRARYMPTFGDVLDHVSPSLTDGDLVLTMGAGDVWKVADGLVERLREPDGPRRALGSADLVSARGHGAIPVSAP